MAYAAPSDLVIRFDAGLIYDLASDTGTPITSGAAATDPVLLAVLSSASGQINSAVTVGNIYTTTDLAALTGDDLAFLKDLTCTIAYAKLLRRRGAPNNLEIYRSLEEWIEAQLRQLRQGSRVFGVEANRSSGLPTIDGPTTLEMQDLNLISDRCTRFYPNRQGRMPYNR